MDRHKKGHGTVPPLGELRRLSHALLEEFGDPLVNHLIDQGRALHRVSWSESRCLRG